MRSSLPLACACFVTGCFDPPVPADTDPTGSATGVDSDTTAGLPTTVEPDDTSTAGEPDGTSTAAEPDTTVTATTGEPETSESSSGTTGPVVCDEGTFGPDCSGVCDCNGGECSDGVDGDGSCTCPPGAFGSDCAGVCACELTACDDGASGTGACLCPDGGDGFIVARLPGWGNGVDDPLLAFTQIAADWASLGDCQPVFVQLSQPVTEANLAASGAHVVLASNPSGGTTQYSAMEIADIHAYVMAGNAGFVSTYLLVHDMWNNAALADLAGIDPLAHQADSSIGCSPDVDVLDATHPLATGLPASFSLASAFPNAQDLGGPWADALLGSAQIVMQSSDGNNVVVAYEGASWRGTRLSAFPEYESVADARQLLYNALLWSASSTP